MKSYFNYIVNNILSANNDEKSREAYFIARNGIQTGRFKDELLNKSDKDIPDFLEYHLRHYTRQDGNYYEWIYEVENIIKFLELNEKQRDTVRTWIEQSEENKRQLNYLKKNLTNLTDKKDKIHFLNNEKSRADDFIKRKIENAAKFGINPRLINPAKVFLDEIEKMLISINRSADDVIYFSYRFGKDKPLSKYQLNVGNPQLKDSKGNLFPFHPTESQLLPKFTGALYDTDVNEIDDFLDFHFNQFAGKKMNWLRYVKSRIDDINTDYKTNQKKLHPANEWIYEWFEKKKTELKTPTENKPLPFDMNSLKEVIYPDYVFQFTEIENELVRNGFFNENNQWKKQKTQACNFLQVIISNKYTKAKIDEVDIRHFFEKRYGIEDDGLQNLFKPSKRKKIEIARADFPFISLPDKKG